MSAAIRERRSRICSMSWSKPRTCSPNLACTSRPAPTKPPRRQCLAPRSIIRCAARSRGSRSSAPMSRPTRCRTWSSPGVIGGALIVLGEDYGEGASVIQERSYAYAMKSSIWLLDPRPDLPTIVHMVEKGFELSEASHAPVMLDLRVRACHVTGEFAAKDNKRGRYNAQHRLAGPVPFEYGRLSHPPATFAQERLKLEQRLPAAQRFICEQKLNELIAGEIAE